jgi:hypothetical protein
MPNTASLVALFLAVLTTACASVEPPTRVENACRILEEKPGWWRALKEAEDRWGTPPAVTLAIIRQESAFNHNARPMRKEGFLFLPGDRPSTAFGYAQALEGTWEEYRKTTGARMAQRDDFEDSADFIGWYTAKSTTRLNLKPGDARSHYLAYHEGHGGFERQTYRSKAWLKDVAAKVDTNARLYAEQLKGCERKLNGTWWPF